MWNNGKLITTTICDFYEWKLYFDKTGYWMSRKYVFVENKYIDDLRFTFDFDNTEYWVKHLTIDILMIYDCMNEHLWLLCIKWTWRRLWNYGIVIKKNLYQENSM